MAIEVRELILRMNVEASRKEIDTSQFATHEDLAKFERRFNWDLERKVKKIIRDIRFRR